MKTHRRSLFGLGFPGAILLALVACDDATGPNSLVEGSWLYSGEVAFSDRECVVEDVLLMLEQAGDTFTGTVQEGTVVCTPGEAEPSTFFQVSSGTIEGDEVEFNMSGDDVRHTGILLGERITGVIQVFVDAEAGIGSFEMRRP